MSATATTPRAVQTAYPSRPGPRFGRLLAAEWTKLTSLRSPWWTAVLTVAVAGAITAVSAQASSVDPGFEPVGSLSTGLVLAQVGPLVLGVLIGAGEFRTGMFRTTFTLAPRRSPVLAAQTIAVAGFALAVALTATAASVGAILPAARSRGIAVDLAADPTPGLLLGMVGFLVGLALFGQAVGALLRRTVPAMLTALFLVLILPLVLVMASPSTPSAGPGSGAVAAGGAGGAGTTAVGTLLAFSPGGAAQLMTMPASAPPMDGSPDLGPVGGGLVLAAWILVLMLAAAVRLRTRDVR